MNPEFTEGKKGDIPTADDKRDQGFLPTSTQDNIHHKDQGSYPTNPDNHLDEVKGQTTEDLTLREQVEPQERASFKKSRTVSFSEDVRDTKYSRIRKKDIDAQSEEASKSSVVVEDDDSGVPYDRGWAWMVDLGCFLLFFVYISHDHWHSVLLIDYLQEFDISISVVTIMLAVGTVCYCFATQISTNVLVIKYSIRIVATSAAILNVGATLLFAAAPSVATFFIANLIKYTVKGVTLIATMILVGHYFRRRRGFATTLGLLGVSASFMCAPPLIRYLREEYGFRGCFLIFAGFEMHGIFAALLLRPINSYKRKIKKVSPGISSVETDEKNPLIAKNSDDQSATPDYIKMTEVIEQLPIPRASIAEETGEVTCDPSFAKVTLLTQNVDRNFEGNINSTKDNFTDTGAKIKSGVTDGDASDEDYVNSNADWQANYETVDNSNTSGQDGTEVKVQNDTVKQDVVDNSSPATNKIQDDQTLTDAEPANQINSKNAELAMSDTNRQIRLSTHENASITSDLVNVQIESFDTYQVKPPVSELSHASNWSLVTISTMGSTPNILQIIKSQPVGNVQDGNQKCTWVQDLIDVSLLKNYLALMIAAMYICVNAGSFSVVYLPSYAKRVGVSSQNAAILLSIVGSMDMVGRLGFGFFVDLKFLRPHLIIAGTCAIIGTVTHFVVLFDGFEKLVFFAVIHGLLAGVGQNLTTVLIVDMVGVQYMAKLLSMSSMFNSFSFMIQHPIQGAIIEATGNFVATFQFVGTSFLLATILLLCEPIIRKLQMAKEKKLALKQKSAAA